MNLLDSGMLSKGCGRKSNYMTISYFTGEQHSENFEQIIHLSEAHFFNHKYLKAGDVFP